MNSPSVNTRPQLIARFEAGDTVAAPRGFSGAILVYLFETAGAPFFRIIVDGGELPAEMPNEFATAAQAIQTAADLCLAVIYDEVAAIEETGDPESDAPILEAFAARQGSRETGGVQS